GSQSLVLVIDLTLHVPLGLAAAPDKHAEHRQRQSAPRSPSTDPSVSSRHPMNSPRCGLASRSAKPTPAKASAKRTPVPKAAGRENRVPKRTAAEARNAFTTNRCRDDHPTTEWKQPTMLRR